MSLNSLADLGREKEKILPLLVNWFNQKGESKEHANTDIPELIVLLQCLGFVLQKFEPADSLNSSNTASPRPNSGSILKLELSCSKSGMKAEVSKTIDSCKCPSQEDANLAQFWNITGCGNNQERVNVSLSSLVPKIAPTKIKIMGHIMAKLLSMIVNDTDINHNEGISTPTSLKRHRSLDALRSDSSSEPSIKPLTRQPNWEVDPKTSPPASTSSPVPDLCKTLDQISLNSSSKAKLQENLKQIIKMAESSLEITTGRNITFTKDSVPRKRVSDIKRRSISEGHTPLMNIVLPSPPRSVQSTSKNFVKPKIPVKLGDKRKFAAITSKVDSRRLGISPAASASSINSTSPRRATPRPLFLLKREGKNDYQDSNKSKTLWPGKKILVKKIETEGTKLRKPKTFENGGTGSTKL